VSDYRFIAVVEGEEIPADHNQPGYYELEQSGAGKRLEYCARCSDPNPDRDECVSAQMFDDNHIVVKAEQFRPAIS
jgi:hypothetical protein